jgi:hypothetical protein
MSSSTSRSTAIGFGSLGQRIGEIYAEPWQIERLLLLVTLGNRMAQRVVKAIVRDSIGADQELEAEHPPCEIA